MLKAKYQLLLITALLVFVSQACNTVKNDSENSVDSNVVVSKSNSKPKITINNDDESDSSSGVEKQKPTAGKGNVQGKVLYNDQPVQGIEVKICENFSTIMGIKCSGKSLITKTDGDGIYVLANLDPKVYGGLTAKVFKSNYYIFPQAGILTPEQFTVEADKTIFARDIHLFKDDVKITNPKAGSQVAAKGIELKWDAYPDASYYKISLYNETGGSTTISNERVQDPSYAVTEDLTNGKYRLKVEAFNDNNHKLSENSDDIKFAVTGGAEPTPTPIP